MRFKTSVPYLILTVVLIMVTMIIQAKSPGKITGTITDAETGDPIMGAAVMIVGTSLGALTDIDGKFVIPNVLPGIYTIKVSHLEFGAVETTGVVVSADTTTAADFQMKRKVSDGDVEIVVKDERDVLNSISGVVTSKEGEVFIRGGRAYEVAYMTEGKPLNDPWAGIPKSAVEKLKRAACANIVRGLAPAHGGTAIVNGEPFDAMFFKSYGVNPFVDTEDDHFSTFAIDVDDAAYVMTRSYLDRGALPPDEAVRVEEFVNHFDYNYAAPHERPFRVFIDGAPSRFGQNCDLLKIGIKGMEIAPENRKAANLVFVVDISGSMATENRLGLVRQALRLLVDELTPNDKVGIVIYGSNGRVLLEPISIEKKFDIVRAIEALQSGGSTNAEEGLRLGYQMADRMFERGKINRIILCSDGVANVGRTSAEDLLKWIKGYADRGITLSSIGFGMGNYNDIMLEKLGNKGNGHYAYVDNLPEARRIFVDNLTGNLQVIARDVKIQVDFNPEVVRSYRLLGYENRDVDDDKFRDDKEDGGEIGSGHEVTALYEIKYHKNVRRDDLGTVFIRFKDPDNGEVTEVNHKIKGESMAKSFQRTAPEFRLAACAAEFAEIMRKSYWSKGSTLDDLLNEVRPLVNENQSAQVIELMGLISKAQQFQEQLAEK